MYDPTKLAGQTMAHTKRLMAILEREFENPGDAFFACVLATSVIAHGAGMPLEDVLNGIRAAYSDLISAEEERQNDLH